MRPTLSEKDKITIGNDWNANENESFWNSIVSRKLIRESVTYQEIDINSFTTELLLRHIQGGK